MMGLKEGRCGGAGAGGGSAGTETTKGDLKGKEKKILNEVGAENIYLTTHTTSLSLALSEA